MNRIHRFYHCLTIFALAILLSSFARSIRSTNSVFPYQKAGLTKNQAAAHLLNRFTYGAKEGDVDRLVKIGLENWLNEQLDGNADDESLNVMLSKFDAINLTNTEVDNIFPRRAQLVRFAVSDGAINKDSVNNENNKVYQQKIADYMQEKGFRPQKELYRQFISQKILRATYTHNQFREIMTDFWFNHFNVSISKNQCASYVPAFERDVIRPNVFGSFEKLLVATAKSPAMLMYLDNFSSAGNNMPIESNSMMMAEPGNNKRKNVQPGKLKIAPKLQKSKAGLNENYAREVMELHTLGVDGGYTQNDVTQAARVLTGWTLAPMSDNGYGAPIKKLVDRVGKENLEKRGFVFDGDFLFAMNRHDNGEKTVLGKKFQSNGGYEEGLALLKMLAEHQATAKFISKKIATRFVSDEPPHGLINKMAATFSSTQGDIKSVIITMVGSPEFWSADALREKTKSPFELAISAVRGLDAKVTQPYQLYSWINKMGQQMYYYQAPTGFPDRGQYWINTGSLLNRMNFGLALAAKRIPGINFSLAAMNDNHEPESAEAALLIYSKLLMPERKLEETVARLKPMLNDPQLEHNVAQAAERTTPAQKMALMVNEDTNINDGEAEKMKKKPANNVSSPTQNGTNTMLAQVVGVIIGSPEFQRK